MASSANKPSGDRMTKKVRNTAHKEHSRLGELRHVESNHPNLWAWSVTILLLVLFSAGPVVIGNDSLLGGLIQFLALGVIAAAILLYLGAEKLLIFDRGIVLGSFAPFLNPYTISFDNIDATTIRATTGSARALGLLLEGRGVSSSSRTVLWSRRSITFLALSPNLMNRDRDAASELWVFAVRGPGRQAPLVHALQEAMVDADVPGAESLVARALPSRSIRGTVADADHLGIPERWRSKRARAAQ